MANPFYVQPASPLRGVMALSEGIGSRVEYERQKTEEAKKQEIRSKASTMIQQKDAEGLLDLTIKNPWISEELKQPQKAYSDSMSHDKIQAALRVIRGESTGSQESIARGEEKIGKGLPADKEIKQAQLYQQNPDQAVEDAKLFLAMESPETLKALQSLKAEKPKTQIVNGQLVTINPEGTASASPIPGLQAKEDAPSGYQWAGDKLEPIPGGPADKEGGGYAPSNLQKMIEERQEYIDQGLTPDDPIIKAYDAKISGTDIDIEDMTPEEVDTWGQLVNLTGKMPSLGRGKQSTKIRMQIAKSAARQALNAAELIPGADPEKKPSEAALEVLGTQADKKAIAGAITFLQKQASSMGSFVNNIEQQIDKVEVLSRDLKTYDTRLLNIPLRTLRGKLAGSALQSKYDLYLAEIESEIGKLATGSTASIAELSATAQQRWEKIHDKNLSIKDMLSLLDETKAAARMRMKSVDDELEKTRRKMRSKGVIPDSSSVELSTTDQQALEWANANPNDPRSAKIKAKLGMQ